MGWQDAPLVEEPAKAPAWSSAPLATAPTLVGSKLGGAVRGINDMEDGAAQLLYNSMPSAVRNAGDAADHWLYANTGGTLGSKPEMNFNQAVTDRNAAYEADRQANGREGFDWARAGGNAVGTAAATLVGLPASGSAGGVAAGSLSPVFNVSTPGEFWTSKGVDAALGGAFGKGFQTAGNAVASVVKPRLDSAVQTLMEKGVSLTPGQMLGGLLKRAEDGATSVPILGDFIKNAQRRSFESFNTAAANDVLLPLGEKLPGSLSGREAMSYLGQRLGDAYDAALGKLGAIRPDFRFHSELQNLSKLTQNLPADKADQFQRIVQNEILSRIDKNGVMTPEAMKAAESKLGEIARGAGRGDYDAQALSDAVQEAQAALRSMVSRVAPPEYAADLQKANAAWARYLRVQRASGMQGSDGGVFTPEQLQSSVRALDASKDKRAFGMGDALMQDLSDPAKSVMGSKVPDSGTPYRSMLALMLTAMAGKGAAPEMAAKLTPAALPMALAGGAAVLPYTRAGQAALNFALNPNRPAGAQKLADGLRVGAGYAAPPMTAATMELLNYLRK